MLPNGNSICLCIPWLAWCWQEVRIYCNVCFLNLHQQASCTATDGRGLSFQQGYADRLLWSVGAAPSITRLFHGRSHCLGLDIWTSTLRHLLRPWKTSQSNPPTASEYEMRRVLWRALPIIPQCREELAPSCRGWCRLKRDRWEWGRERKQGRGNSKSGGEMAEVFMSVGLRVFLACLCIIEVVVCGTAPHKTVIILPFMMLFWHSHSSAAGLAQ